MNKKTDSLPWDFIRTVTFFKKDFKMVIKFDSGAMIESIAPNIHEWMSLVVDADMHLEKDQVIHK